ncbi:PREDICTED: cystatin-9-like [Colobus angolensis palliatus]|uniref:cystatin-9-like n=1 Tax=Colobus angolensis palliatus TaxID=336983 RepID=UPI0005F4D894|nr:PREDICTED: cystatin-9-like [Colobus angolensis palliatus]
MSSAQRRKALPWALSLLLMGFQLLVPYAWCSEEEMGGNNKIVQDPMFLATVEFALNTFNVQSKEEHAYRLLRVLSSWREDSMDRKTFTCFFTISTRPWRTYFSLLNKTCLEGFH